jgi:hypothetical protein
MWVWVSVGVQGVVLTVADVLANLVFALVLTGDMADLNHLSRVPGMVSHWPLPHLVSCFACNTAVSNTVVKLWS